MKHTNSNGYGLLVLLLTVLIIGILLSVLLPQYKNSIEKTAPSGKRTSGSQGVNVKQIQKQLNDTVKKHERDLDNYEKSLQR